MKNSPYKAYKGDRMPSALPQKTKAEPEGNKQNRNEDKLKTINQITSQRGDKYKKDFADLGARTDLSKNKKIAKNEAMFNKMQSKNKASMDSINRVTAADFKFVNDNIDDFSQDELDRMANDGFFTKIN